MKHVAYVLLRFPYATETFVADEIWEMKRQGVPVRVFSLLRPKDNIPHARSSELADETQHAPGLFSLRLWLAQLYFLAWRPRDYVAALVALVRQPYPASPVRALAQRLVTFLKAVAIAFDLRNAEVEIVHSHFAWLAGAAAMVIARLLRIPFTQTIHAYDIYASNDLLDLVTRSAGQVVAISQYNKDQILARSRTLDPDKVTVIHCGIDLGLFVPSPRTERHEGPLRILSVGSLLEKKGHAYLIQACRLLAAQGFDFTCTIIGEGPLRGRLQESIRKAGLDSRVILAGGCSRGEVLDAYRHSDIFVLACHLGRDGDRDGIPVALMEAMAMQLPVVSTRVSGIPELVRDQETGLLVPDGDTAAIAQAIRRFAQDHGLVQRVTKNARVLIQSEFELEENVSRLVQIQQLAGTVSTGRVV